MAKAKWTGKLFSWDNPRTHMYVGAFIGACLVLFFVSQCAEAQENEVGGGLAIPTSNVNDSTLTLEYTRVFGGGMQWDVNLGYIGAFHCAPKERCHNVDSTFYTSLNYRFYAPDRRTFLFLGASYNEENALLPLNNNFSLGLGWYPKGLPGYVLEIKHFSNSGLTDPNTGLNWIMLSKTW